MRQRLGTFLHQLGLSLAAFAVVGAVVLNAGALQQRLDAQKNLRTLASQRSELPTALPEAYSKARASTEDLKSSLRFGGIWIIGGLVAYGIGWSARYVSRRPKT